MAAATPKVSLKLFIDKNNGKVLYAEADKHFVDFLFYIVSLPIASIIKNLDDTMNSQLVVGSLGKLYNSIANIAHTYLQPDKEKDTILNPKLPILPSDKVPLLLPGDLFTEKKFYTCSSYRSQAHRRTYVTHQSSDRCPECSNPMSKELSYVWDCPRVEPPGFGGHFGVPMNVQLMHHMAVFGSANVALKKVASSSGSVDGGFVKGGVTYMVMDDLEVKPLSTTSSFSVLTMFNIKDVESIEVKDVDLGVDEGLKLLKAALCTQSVLTTVFIGETTNLPSDETPTTSLSTEVAKKRKT